MATIKMPDHEMTKLLDGQATVQERLDALAAWDLDVRLEIVALRGRHQP
jgi:hypothetical protein